MKRLALTGLILLGSCSDSRGPAGPSTEPQPWHSAEPSIERASVHGRARSASGEPIVNARVFMAAVDEDRPWPLDAPAWIEAGLPILEARTGAGGEFEFEALEPGRYRLELRGDALAPVERGLVFCGAGERVDLGTLLVEPGRTVRARVVSPNARPVADVPVYAHVPERDNPAAHAWTGSPVGRTDRRGEIVIDELASGPFRLTVDVPDAPALVATGFVEDELDLGVLTTTEGVTLTGTVLPNPLGSLDGQWVHALPTAHVPYVSRDGETGVPAHRLRDYRRTPISPGGEFSLTGLAPDTPYSVRILGRDDPLRVVDAWSEPALVFMEGDREVLLSAHPTVYMEFSVRDRATGDLVMEYEHRWIGARNVGVRGIDDLRATTKSRRVTLEVSAKGYRTARSEPLAFVPTNSLVPPVVELERAPRLAVRVVSPAGEPVPGARAVLALVEGDGSTKRSSESETGADGRVELDDEPERARVLALFAPGFAPRLVDLRGVRDELEVALGKGGSIQVRLVDETGRPRSGVELCCTPRDELERALWPNESLRRITDATGLVRFERVSPGRHVVSLVRAPESTRPDPWLSSSALDALPGFASGDSEPLDETRPGSRERGFVTVTDGDVAPLELVTSRLRSLPGTLTIDGEPATGARLSVHPWREPSTFFASTEVPLARTRANADGRFELVFESEGRALLLVEHPASKLPVLRTIEPSARDLDLGLRTRTLRVAIVDADGRPAPRAELSAIGIRKRDRRLGPAPGPGNRNLAAWSEWEPGTKLGTCDELGELELPVFASAVEFELGAHAPGIGRGVRRVRDFDAPVSLLLSSNSRLRVEGFDPKRGTRALGIAWRWGHDFLHPLTFTLDSVKDRTFEDLSADSWTIFQADLDGWGEIENLRVLAPASLDPVGDSVVDLR